MTPAEMIVEIGDFGFTDVASARLYASLNQALKEITNKRPWSWRETNTTLTFDGTNPNPSNVGFVSGPVVALTDPSTGYQMTPLTRQQYQKSYPQNLSDAGSPVFYYFDGPTLKVWRVPGSTQTLNLNHLARQTAVTASSVEADVLLPADYHWMAIFLTLSRLYWKDDDLEMAQWARSESERLEQLMVLDSEMRTAYDRPMTIETVGEGGYEDYN